MVELRSFTFDAVRVAVWVACLFPLLATSLPKSQETMTARPVITKCWECMSYNEGKLYDQCPLEGMVDPTRAFLGNCTGMCMTHTDDRNPLLVVRGCTASQWGLPSPLPEDGCYPFYSEIWCICRTDGCNGVRLDFDTVKSKQLDYLVDYSSVSGGGNANAARMFHQLSLSRLTEPGVVLLGTAVMTVVFP